MFENVDKRLNIKKNIKDIRQSDDLIVVLYQDGRGIVTKKNSPTYIDLKQLSFPRFMGIL